MSTKTEKTAAKVSKFQTILTSTGQEVLDKRSEIVLNRTKSAMLDRIASLNRQKENLELEVLNLTDLSIETTDSLRPGSKAYNADAWVDELISLHTQIQEVDEVLEVANSVYQEYFG